MGIFIILLFLFILIVLGRIIVDDIKKIRYERHVRNLFQPGVKIKKITTYGYIHPKDEVILEAEIMEVKDNYVLMHFKNGKDYECSMRNLFIDSDRIDFYDENENFIENVNSNKYLY